MSATLERGRSAAPRPEVGKAAPAQLFQVNLLPPEVRDARSLAVAKRWLGIGLIATVALNGLGFAGAHMITSAAESELVDAQSETALLKAEEAKYAEVPRVLNALSQTDLARQIGMSTEISWKPYLDAITSVLPTGVSITTFTLTGPSLSASNSVQTDALTSPGIGSITFDGRTKTIPDTAAWLDALSSVPGFADPWVSSVTIAEEEGVVFYSVSTTVQLSDSTFAQRFIEPKAAN